MYDLYKPYRFLMDKKNYILKGYLYI